MMKWQRQVTVTSDLRLTINIAYLKSVKLKFLNIKCHGILHL